MEVLMYISYQKHIHKVFSIEKTYITYGTVKLKIKPVYFVNWLFTSVDIKTVILDILYLYE